MNNNYTSMNNFVINHQLLLNLSKTKLIQFHTQQYRNITTPLIEIDKKQNEEVKIQIFRFDY